MKYLVTVESEDGNWLSEPEGFDTREEAVKYSDHIKGFVLTGRIQLYETTWLEELNKK